MSLRSVAASALTRAVQFTKEKLGVEEGEITEYDRHFDILAERADKTKAWTEQLVSDTEAVLQPNPGNRVEDFVLMRIEGRRPERMRNLEWLGAHMMAASADFGADTVYGATLARVGLAQQQLGDSERELVTTCTSSFLDPLNNFLENEMKDIVREKRTLSAKRLDLDAAKAKVKKLKATNNNTFRSDHMIELAEKEVTDAQVAFDRQTEDTRALLEEITPCQANHLQCLLKFVQAQANHYSRCNQVMQTLLSDLASKHPNFGMSLPLYAVSLDDEATPSANLQEATNASL